MFHPDKTVLQADGQDLAFIALQLFDENGVPVRINDRVVNATVEGTGKLLGIDSGEMRRAYRFNSHELPTYQGRCMLVIQAGRSKGMMSVKVCVEGLPEQTITIKVH